MHFTFGAPWFLFLLTFIPCFKLCKPPSETYWLSTVAWIERGLLTWDRDFWLKSTIFALLIIALADPFVYRDVDTHNPRKGRDLVVALDASGSMAQSGFDKAHPFRSKYDTALALTDRFLQARYNDNIGIVLFGTFAYTASPLTYDLAALRKMLATTDVGLAGENTAIGDAIVQSLRTLRYGKAKRKAIVLLTDGRHNAGAHSPKEAVAAAKKEHVVVYTIGIGKKGDYDAALLRKIAEETGGKSFDAADAEALQKIYDTIDELEPSPIRSERYLGKHSLGALPILFALLLLIGWTLRMRKETV